MTHTNDSRQGRKRTRKSAAPPNDDGEARAQDGGVVWERVPEAGPCKVQPIGHRKGRYYFFDPAGQFVELTAAALGQAPQIRSLFGGAQGGSDWLRHRFPHFDREGRWSKGFDLADCNDWLVGECYRAGVFDPDTQPLRDHGVWSADGAIAVHLGDRIRFITTDGKCEDFAAGFVARGALWQSSAPIAPPAPPCGEETAQQVERLFGRWSWWHLNEKMVFTGLWAAGLLGAAISWRPHGLLIGPPGSGKSTLLSFYRALSPLAFYANDYSEPGLRQKLTARAAPLVLDEADEDADTMARLQSVVTLLRKASGGDGAKVVRGTGDGTSMSYTVTSPAMLGSVLPPPLLPQDATRITKMELLRIPDDAPPFDQESALAWSRSNALALWGRAISGVGRFKQNLAILRRAMHSMGCAPRLGDQLGTILAARAMMLEDSPIDDYAAREDLAKVGWLVQTQAQAVEDGGPMRCLQHLLNSTADVLESGQRPTFEQLIHRARNPSDDDARRKLISHGMKVHRFPPGAVGVPESLLVSRSHPQLTRVFAGTHWAGNRWADDLKHLPGSSVPENSVSFRHGVKARVVVISPEHFSGADDGANEGSPRPIDADQDIPI